MSRPLRYFQEPLCQILHEIWIIFWTRRNQQKALETGRSWSGTFDTWSFDNVENALSSPMELCGKLFHFDFCWAVHKQPAPWSCTGLSWGYQVRWVVVGWDRTDCTQSVLYSRGVCTISSWDEDEQKTATITLNGFGHWCFFFTSGLKKIRT